MGTGSLEEIWFDEKAYLVDFSENGKMGEGTQGSVYVAVERATGSKFAVKVVSTIDPATSREVNVLVALPAHLNVVDYFGSTTAPTLPGKKLLLMELCSRADLFDRITEQGRLEESAARALFQQLVAGMFHLHSHGIFHRDLKLENLLIGSNGEIKICDFGFALDRALEQGSSMCKAACGSVAYCAPEVMIAARTKGQYDAALCDMWSLGVVLYVMLTGVWPFEVASFKCDYFKQYFADLKERRRILPNHPMHKPWLQSPALDELLLGILNPNPKSRWDIARVLSCEWLAGPPPREGSPSALDAFWDEGNALELTGLGISRPPACLLVGC